MPHLLFSGSAGVGKTTTALCISKEILGEHWRDYTLELNASDERGINMVRERVKKFSRFAGLDTKKIIKTVDNLVSANQALIFYKNRALYKHASFVSKEKCLINKKIFSEEAGEIIFKSFSDILSLVSGTYYPPRSKKVINLINRLKKNKFAKSTLGGCIVQEKDNFILISRELKIRKMTYQLEK